MDNEVECVRRAHVSKQNWSIGAQFAIEHDEPAVVDEMAQ